MCFHYFPTNCFQKNICFLSTCYRISLRTGSNSSLVKNNELVILFSVSIICRYLTFLLSFSTDGHRVLDVINVCYLILLFVLSRILDNGKFPRPSKAAIFFIH